MPLLRATTLILLTLCPLAAQVSDGVPTIARALLKEMVDADTTGEHGDTTPLVESLARQFRAAGVPAADIAVVGPEARHRNLVVRLRGRSAQKPLLVLSHLDVVEAKREDWTRDPFRLTETQGWFYGRGTQDIKGEAAVEAAAFLRMAQEGVRPSRDLILALTTGEEGGTFYNGIEWLLANRRDLIEAEYCLNGDGGSVTSRKGVARYRTLQTAEKGFYMLDIEVTDPGGHSSLPRPGNPIHVLGAALGRLEGFQLPLRVDESHRAFWSRMGQLESGPLGEAMRALGADPGNAAAAAVLSQDPTWNANLRTTVKATRLSGGHADNALPQSARASLNIRLLPGDDVQEIVALVRQRLADPRVKVKLATPPKPNPASPLRADLLAVLERTTAAQWPGLPVVPCMDTGGSDGAYLRAAGIPTYGISAIPIDEDDVRAHGQDERIRVVDFDRGVEAFDRLIRELAK
ncbi:MAG TPA: M20/M25/M40 family metallo-hydrolase [Holophagaceae bacterium]|nr:M20/M25/M40 family metallo-hydrolase [Holophagaceae bacterium]